MSYILEKIYDIEVLDKILEETAEIREKSNEYLLTNLKKNYLYEREDSIRYKEDDCDRLLSRYINTETGDYVIRLPAEHRMYDIDVDHRNLIYYKGKSYVHVSAGVDQPRGRICLYKELPPVEDQEGFLEMMRAVYRLRGFNEPWDEKKPWTQFIPTHIELLEKWIGARHV